MIWGPWQAGAGWSEPVPGPRRNLPNWRKARAQGPRRRACHALPPATFRRGFAAARAGMLPPVLIGRLRPGGRMVPPTGLAGTQRLTAVEEDAAGSGRAAGTRGRQLQPARDGAMLPPPW